METEAVPVKMPFWKTRKFLYVLGICYIFGLIIHDASKTQPQNTTTPTTQAVATSQPVVTSANTRVSVGEEGYVNTPSPKAVISLTEDGFSEITKIYLANDMMGVGDFLLSGKGFAVPKGTKVLVTDTKVGARKVRILEGENIGQTGWIAMEWVSKTK